MHKRISKSILAVACLLCFSNATYAQNPFKKVGQWWGEVKYQFKLDSQRNNATPQPFSAQDQMSVQQTFAPMYARGAVINRIMDSVHFDPTTHELNNAGRHRLRQILSQQKSLDIYVASTMNPKVDKARQAQLKDLLAQYSFPGHRPGVSNVFYTPHHYTGSEEATLRETYFSVQKSPTLESVAGQVSGSAE